MRRFRFHIPGIPHTITNKTYVSCAYTQKVHKLCGMLLDLGHEVYHYGCEGSDPRCTEDVHVVSADYRREFYNTDFTKDQFRFDQNDEFHQTFQRRCAEEINKRKQRRDFLLCAWGWGHEPISRMANTGDMITVESGIGYESTFANFRVFESYTWMSHVYGLANQRNGSWYDCVIPNFFDPTDFEYREEKENWFLYLGRVVQRKGVDVAVQVTREIGARLLIAGQGGLINEAEGLRITDPHVEHVGFADVARRRDLLSRAKAVFMPTYYIEPFGGVSIESALSGTPVISSDWGVFAENIIDGVTGYRCRTIDQFCKAALAIDRISPAACREWAIKNFSLNRVAEMYQEYFEMLYDVWGEGWYARRPDSPRSDWLRRVYPEAAAAPRSVVDTGNARPKPRVAVWTHVEWAFGRIYGDLRRLLKDEFTITLLDWNQAHTPREFETYDLVYIPIWSAVRDFRARYPAVPPERIASSIHGPAELFNFDLSTGAPRALMPAEIEGFEIPANTLAFLREMPALSVISPPLFERLQSKYELPYLQLTPAGFDPEIFKPAAESATRENSKGMLRVLYPLPRPGQEGYAHGYDVKRAGVLERVEERLQRENIAARIIFSDRLRALDEMPELYHQGDIHVCVSHSEGLPTVGLEAAASGLAQLSTPVGVMPDLVVDGLTGYLLRGQTEEELVDELTERIRELAADPARVARMQANAARRARETYAWDVHRKAWVEFFNAALAGADKARFAPEPVKAPALRRRPRVGIWTDVTWSLGRIHHDLRKFLRADFDIELLNWDTIHKIGTGAYDLIHCPSWVELPTFEKIYGTPPSSLATAVHSYVSLFYYAATERKNLPYSPERLRTLEIHPGSLELLKSVLCVGVVSPQIADVLVNRYGLSNVVTARSGFDPALFFPRYSESEELRVLYPLKRDMPSAEAYDAKRIRLVLEAERRLAETHPRVRFIFPDQLMTLEEMPDFYRAADVHVLSSSAEGGPLVAIESAACGLAQISTPVGIVPELVRDGESGYLLRETDEEKLVQELCARIGELDEDRDKLRRMKAAAAEAAHADWTWEKRREGWREFFERGLEAASRNGNKQTRFEPERNAPAADALRVLIKLPTRGRPEQFFKTLDAYYARLAQPELTRFLISCHDDDESMNNARVRERLDAYPNLKYRFAPPMTKIEAYNAHVADEDFDILVLAADDLIPSRHGFDRVIRESMARHFPDFDGALWFNDGYTGRRLNTHPIVGSAYYRRFGYVFHPDYASIYCDNEFTETAEYLGRIVYHDEVLLRHASIWNTGGEPDETARDSVSDAGPDEALFLKRRTERFDFAKAGPRAPGLESISGLDKVCLHVLNTAGLSEPAPILTRSLIEEYSQARHVVIHTDDARADADESLFPGARVLYAPRLTLYHLESCAPRLIFLQDPEGERIFGEHPYDWLRESGARVVMAHHRPTQPLIKGDLHLFFDEAVEKCYANIKHLMGACARVGPDAQAILARVLELSAAR